MKQSKGDRFTRIGLSGGIASGKSTVSAYLKNKGYVVIDADLISHRLAEKGQSLYRAIVDTFGSEVVDNRGKLDRAKLAGLVFSDKKKLDLLDSISHPLIFEEIMREAEDKDRGNLKDGLLFFDIPLLFENPQCRSILNIDSVWLVTCSEENQIKRIIERDGLDRSRALKRIKSQMPGHLKEEKADLILYNDSGLQDLYEEVEKGLRAEREKNENI